MRLNLSLFGAILIFTSSTFAVWKGDETSAYPSTVGISVAGTSCTAVVLAPHWILTAGHCVEGGTRSKRMGLRQGNGSSKSVSVVRIFPHPNYRAGFFENPSTNEVPYDLALIQLENAISIPAAKFLASKTEVQLALRSKIAFAVGYGKSGKFGNKKRVAALPTNLTNKDYFEAKSNAQGQGICVGDSGGGLYVSTPKGVRVIGINSVKGKIKGTNDKNECGGTNTIGAIASIYAQADWIRQVSGVQF